MDQAGRPRRFSEDHDDAISPSRAFAAAVRLDTRFFDVEAGIAGTVDNDADSSSDNASVVQSFIDDRNEENMTVYGTPVSPPRFPPYVPIATASRTDIS